MKVILDSVEYWLKPEVGSDDLVGSGLCDGCSFSGFPKAGVCSRRHEELLRQLGKDYFDLEIGGCGLNNHVLVRDEDMVMYLEMMVKNEERRYKYEQK